MSGLNFSVFNFKVHNKAAFRALCVAVPTILGLGTMTLLVTPEFQDKPLHPPVKKETPKPANIQWKSNSHKIVEIDGLQTPTLLPASKPVQLTL